MDEQQDKITLDAHYNALIEQRTNFYHVRAILNDRNRFLRAPERRAHSTIRYYNDSLLYDNNLFMANRYEFNKNRRIAYFD